MWVMRHNCGFPLPTGIAQRFSPVGARSPIVHPPWSKQLWRCFRLSYLCLKVAKLPTLQLFVTTLTGSICLGKACHSYLQQMFCGAKGRFVSFLTQCTRQTRTVMHRSGLFVAKWMPYQVPLCKALLCPNWYRHRGSHFNPSVQRDTAYTTNTFCGFSAEVTKARTLRAISQRK